MKKVNLFWTYAVLLLFLTIKAIAVPSVSGALVLPQNPNAGQDLLCNYTYSSQENYTEQNSTFKWWKNGVDQNINSQILNRDNLSVSDKWSCEVTGYDGLNFSSPAQSTNNVTILNTVKNLTMYINGTNLSKESGYFGGNKLVIGFDQELNNALADCTADAEGFCNISLTFSSDNVGLLNISNIGIYYSIPQDTNKFFIKNSSGNNVAWFGDAGNVVIKGVLEQNSNYQRTANDEFIIRNKGEDVLILDTVNGSLYIDGTLFENQATLNPKEGSDDFIIKDNSGNVVAFVNESGYLFLKGTLTQNGNP